MSTEMKQFVANMGEMFANMGEMKNALADIQTKFATMGTGGGNAPHEMKAQTDALRKYMQTGEIKAGQSINDGPSGGYLVPPFLVKELWDRLIDYTSIRSYAKVINIPEGAIAKVPVDKTPASAQWVGETQKREDTADNKFGIVDIGLEGVATVQSITRDLLSSSYYPFEQHVIGRGFEELVIAESLAFVDGDGFKKPLGLFSDKDVKTIKTTDTGKIGIDDLLDMTAEVPIVARSNACFIMDPKTLVGIRKLKDADGQYLWQPPVQAGHPSVFAGYPVLEVVRDPNAKSFAKQKVLFGDLRNYMIVDHAQNELIRDDFSAKRDNKVEFMIQKRVGGAIIRPDAFVKLEVK